MRISACFLLVTVACALVTGSCRQQSLTERMRRDADPEALSLLVEAQRFFETGLYNYALGTLEAAETKAPELADIPFLRGRVLAAMRQFDGAQVAYGRVLELNPDYPGVHQNMGNVEYLRGEPRIALDHYRLEHSSATDSADFHVQLGRVEAAVGEVADARASYERAIEIDPTDPTAYMWLGQLLEDEGAIEEALSYSRRGMELDPGNLDYTYVAGVQLLRLERYEEAAVMLETAADGMPGHYAAHYNLGQALMGLGRSESAARYLARADTLLQVQQELTRWENLVSTNSQEPMLWVNYGNALTEAGRLDDAIGALSIAYSLNPQWLELQNNIANLLLARGDTLEAIDRYRGILIVDSTLTDIWLNLGTVYALGHRYDDARLSWETALRYSPGDDQLREYLSRLPAK